MGFWETTLAGYLGFSNLGLNIGECNRLALGTPGRVLGLLILYSWHLDTSHTILLVFFVCSYLSKSRLRFR